MIVEGMIQDASTRTVDGAKGPFEVIDIVVGGVKVSGYADKYGFLEQHKLDESKAFKIEYKKNAKGYHQIESVAPIEPKAPATTAADNKASVAKEPDNDPKGRSIEKQVCVYAAADVLKHRETENITQQFTFNLCQWFWDWMRTLD